jgi:phosphohistidine phosphatase
MRTLYLIRHAKSSWDNPGVQDFDRTLNPRGLKDAVQMAELLQLQRIKPDLLVSSPAVRAYSTARIFAEKLGIPEHAITKNPDIYEAMPTTILRIISRLPEEARVVLLFGHNPTFTEVANVFSRQFIDNIPTCGIVQIESGAETWDRLTEGNSRVKSCFFPKELL